MFLLSLWKIIAVTSAWMIWISDSRGRSLLIMLKPLLRIPHPPPPPVPLIRPNARFFSRSHVQNNVRSILASRCGVSQIVSVRNQVPFKGKKTLVVSFPNGKALATSIGPNTPIEAYGSNHWIHF